MGDASCPGCGRPAPAGRTKCMYCGGRLVPLVACAKCRRPLEPTATKCMMCGTATGAAAPGAPSASTLAVLRVEMYQEAERLRTAQKVHEALPLFRTILEADPQHALAWLGLAKSLALLGQHAAAAQAIDRALAAKPDLPEAQRLRATFAAAAGRQSDASLWELLRRATKALDERRFEQALALLDEMIAAANPGLAAHTDMAAILSARARALVGLGRFQDALVEAERSLARDPRHAPAWAVKGDAQDELGQLDEAVFSFDRAVSLEPNTATFWIDRGYVLRKKRRLDDALVSYDRGLALAPDNAIGWSNKGNVHLELGQHAHAIAAYERALAIYPKLENARKQLAKLTAQPDPVEAYAASFEKMFGCPLDFSPASLLAADHVFDMVFHAGTKVNPRDGAMAKYIAEVLRRTTGGAWKGEPFVADRLYDRYAEHAVRVGAKPAGKDVKPWLAYADRMLGHRLLDEAAFMLETALSIDPAHAEAKAALARVRAELDGPRPPGVAYSSMLELLSKGGPAEAFTVECLGEVDPDTIDVVCFTLDVPLSNAKKWDAAGLANVGVRADVLTKSRDAYTTAFEGTKPAVTVDPVVLRAWAALVASGRIARVTIVANVPFDAATKEAAAAANARLGGPRLALVVRST